MALSIKTKIWLPAIAVSLGLVFMSVGSAVRTVPARTRMSGLVAIRAIASAAAAVRKVASLPVSPPVDRAFAVLTGFSDDQ